MLLPNAEVLIYSGIITGVSVSLKSFWQRLGWHHMRDAKVIFFFMEKNLFQMGRGLSCIFLALHTVL